VVADEANERRLAVLALFGPRAIADLNPSLKSRHRPTCSTAVIAISVPLKRL
jgi:hypothetical protein